MRKSASIRLGLLLAASALLSSCTDEKPPERRCVDGDGRFADEAHCASTEAKPPPDGGPAEGATGSWDEGGGPQRSGGGYHFIWIPFGSYGGVGTYAAGFQRRAGGATGGASSGAATSGSVSRGGFGATGAAHAGASAGSSGGGHGAAAGS